MPARALTFRPAAGAAAALLAAICILYWPVVHGDFVWDDVVNFRWNDWLTRGDQWKHYIFKGFNFWAYYFRPLVVGLFTVQLRLFDGAPGPMHLVSLGFHLLNTLLVGLLALRCADSARLASGRRALALLVPMALFGLHPSVIETVAWVGCQYDLLLTTFTLLGLLASTSTRRPVRRALLVAGCFFLAALTKESAVAFPLVLVAFDWAVQARRDGRAPPLRRFVARNLGTWAAVLAAGLAYLAFRHLAMGPSVMPAADPGLSLVGHVQLVCSTYIRYWRTVFLPTWGMGPVHEFSPGQFEPVTAVSALVDIAAVAIPAASAWFAFRRGSALACIALVVTASLLPVLRILPVAFNPNLFHDRYLTCGLAVACAMLPLLRPHLPGAVASRLSPGFLRGLAAGVAMVWLALSAVAIRTTVPLWANETSLWTWAYATDPDSVYAISNLLELDLAAGRLDRAGMLADRVLAERIECTQCLPMIGKLALREGDAERAERVLQVLRLNPRVYRPNVESHRRLLDALERLAARAPSA